MYEGTDAPRTKLSRKPSGSLAMASCAVSGTAVARTLATDENSGAAVTDAMKESAAAAIEVACYIANH